MFTSYQYPLFDDDSAPPPTVPFFKESWEKNVYIRFMNDAYIESLRKKFNGVIVETKGLQCSFNKLFRSL